MNKEIQKRMNEYFERPFSVSPDDFEVQTTEYNQVKFEINLSRLNVSPACKRYLRKKFKERQNI